jgi:hypothetical protein
VAYTRSDTGDEYPSGPRRCKRGTRHKRFRVSSLRNTTAPGRTDRRCKTESERRLPGAGETSNRHEARMRWMQQLLGHREILARQILKLAAALHVMLNLRGRRAGLCANSRTAGQKKREQRDAVEVCSLRQVTIPHGIGVARQPAPPAETSARPCPRGQWLRGQRPRAPRSARGPSLRGPRQLLDERDRGRLAFRAHRKDRHERERAEYFHRQLSA